MSEPISRVGLMIVLAFLVPIIVELRTIAGFLGFALSPMEYLAVAAALVVVVLAGVAVWNLRADEPAANSSGGV